jgi:hypothetical protein
VVQSGGLHQYLPKQPHDALGTQEIFYHYEGGTEPDNKALNKNEVNSICCFSLLLYFSHFNSFTREDNVDKYDLKMGYRGSSKALKYLEFFPRTGKDAIREHIILITKLFKLRK